MKKGTNLLYSTMGFLENGESRNPNCSHELKFDQFVDGKILGITKEGHIMVVKPDFCKLQNPEQYFDDHPESPLLG